LTGNAKLTHAHPWTIISNPCPPMNNNIEPMPTHAHPWTIISNPCPPKTHGHGWVWAWAWMWAPNVGLWYLHNLCTPKICGIPSGLCFEILIIHTSECSIGDAYNRGWARIRSSCQYAQYHALENWIQVRILCGLAS
jgi:hypothetical protein